MQDCILIKNKIGRILDKEEGDLLQVPLFLNIKVMIFPFSTACNGG